jgi:hypothetical protein
VRILTVMGAVYNGLEGVYPLEEQGTASLSLQKSLYDSRELGRRRVEGVLLANYTELDKPDRRRPANGPPAPTTGWGDGGCVPYINDFPPSPLTVIGDD